LPQRLSVALLPGSSFRLAPLPRGMVRRLMSKRVDPTGARVRFGEARVAHLATITGDDKPHLVPCCFVLDGAAVYSAVDAKPKSTLALRRLDNIAAHAVASVLVDHYDEDWSQLWWVRVDGWARLVVNEPERHRVLALLEAKYEQYRRQPPPGPIIALDITAWRFWSAAGAP
jgi:PPOX class probable F420-dependent enzyme